MTDEIANLELAVKTEEYGTVVQVCLLATLYFENAHQPKVRAAVLDCLEDYCSMANSHLRWMRQPGSSAFHPIPPGQTPSIRNWLEGISEHTPWEFFLHGGEQVDSASSFSIRALGSDKNQEDLSYFRLSLPLTWFADHPGSFPEKVLDYCKKLCPLSGYGGPGIIESPDLAVRKRFEPAVFAIAQRFPGIEVDNPVAHSLYLRDGIKGVNWLTMLGDRWLQKLGGVSALQKELGEQFFITTFPGGVQIQAGPQPQLGDSTQGRLPTLYKRLSFVLKPIRIKKHRAFHFPGPERFDRQASEVWLSRFDS